MQISENNAKEIFAENSNKIMSDINSSINPNITVDFHIPEKLEFTDGVWWFELDYHKSGCIFHIVQDENKTIKILSTNRMM